MKLDFHVHTGHSSDSLIRLVDLKRKSDALGIIPALTDHCSIESHREARSLGMKFVPGEEILTDKGDLIGLYLNELIPKGTPFLEAIDRIHGQGGLAYLPHMFDYGRSGSHASGEEAAKADIIEVFNARCMDDRFNQKAKAFAQTNHLPEAAGSDSHYLFEFGSTCTELPDFDMNAPRMLLKSLPRANLIMKKAPFYVRGTTSFISAAKKLLRPQPLTKPI
jgi:predicted metal-dependent phosphoesterase TrpH